MKEERIELKEQNVILPSGVCNLVLLKSNGGFGKTARMKEYLEKQEKTAIWMELDPECNHKDIFIRRFLQQIMIADVNGKYNRPESLYNNTGFSFYQSKEVREKERQERIFEMIDRMDQINTVFVFTHIHIIWNQEVVPFIETLVKRNTECKVFMLGREEPQFLMKYIISGQCKVIGEKQLFMEKREIAQMVLHKLGYQPCYTDKLVDELLYYFQGWPAGTDAIIRYIKAEEIAQSDIDVCQMICESWIEKYVLYEIFGQIPPEELRFLKMLSLVPQSEEKLEFEIHKQSHCENTLEELHKKFFFLIRRQNSYRFIPVFQILLSKIISKEECIQITRMITSFYFSQNEYEKANDYVLKQDNLYIVEDYFERNHQLLQSKEKTSLCINCILYFICRNEPLSATLMWFTAEIFNADYDRKQLDNSEREDVKAFQTERQFYMSLLSYNRSPAQYRERLQCYLEKVKNPQICKKKVSIQCFGTFEVKLLEDDKVLSWRTKKGCELFAFLYHMQGKPITREVLMDVLWRDGIPKNGVAMLHNMIYNIRKELAPYGLEELIQYKDKMYRLNMDWLESDYDMQMELCEHAGDEKYLIAREAVLLKYPGQYLESVDAHWTMELKEYYDRKYMECCMFLAGEYMEKNKYEKALILLKNVRIVDELREDAVEKVLYCLGMLGERKLVMQEYRRFEKLIRMELNVEPCEGVKEMYEVAMRL